MFRKEQFKTKEAAVEYAKEARREGHAVRVFKVKDRMMRDRFEVETRTERKEEHREEKEPKRKEEPKKSHWIHRAIKHRGSLKEWATKHHLLKDGKIDIREAKAEAEKEPEPERKKRLEQIELAERLATYRKRRR